jgi:cyclophilin family peptidyl-prolyl cis-trans isomerase
MLGRLIFELRADVVPRTAENFRQICTGEAGFSYVGTEINRFRLNHMMQGGDVDGQGGRSIYGERFEDESFELRHNAKGCLSMYSEGPNDNGSKFNIGFQPTPWFDNRHVVFGELYNTPQAQHVFFLLDKVALLHHSARKGSTYMNVRLRDHPVVRIVGCGEIPIDGAMNEERAHLSIPSVDDERVHLAIS